MRQKIVANKKVAVIGAGNVGAEIANQIISKDLADVILLDKMGDMARGKALDILQSAPLKNSGANIVGTDSYEEIENSDLVIITAGLPRKPGMSREELVEVNGNIISQITENVKKYAPNSIILVVTNPLDVMTFVAYKVSGFESNRVFGMAGVLDTARYKAFIGMELGVCSKDVNAMVLGGHGDDMVPLVDSTTVSGIPLRSLLSKDKIEEIVTRTRKGGGEIVGLLKTGSAYYAPAYSSVVMAEAILKDQKAVIPASVLLQGQYNINDIYIGAPAIIGANGIEKVIELELSDNDLSQLQQSAGVVRKTIEKFSKVTV